MEGTSKEADLPTGVKRYRVETFIIPKIQCELFRSTEEFDLTPESFSNDSSIGSNVNEIDDVKIANKSKLEEIKEDFKHESEKKVSNELQVIAKVLTIENVMSISNNVKNSKVQLPNCHQVGENLKGFDGNVIKTGKSYRREETMQYAIEGNCLATAMKRRNNVDLIECGTNCDEEDYGIEEPPFHSVFHVKEADSIFEKTKSETEVQENSLSSNKVLESINEDISQDCYRKKEKSGLNEYSLNVVEHVFTELLVDTEQFSMREKEVEYKNKTAANVSKEVLRKQNDVESTDNQRNCAEEAENIKEPIYQSISELKKDILIFAKAECETEIDEDPSKRIGNLRSFKENIVGQNSNVDFQNRLRNIEISYEFVANSSGIEENHSSDLHENSEQDSTEKNGVRENNSKIKKIINEQTMNKNCLEVNESNIVSRDKGLKMTEPLYENIAELKDSVTKMQESKCEIENHKNSLETMKTLEDSIRSVDRPTSYPTSELNLSKWDSIISLKNSGVNENNSNINQQTKNKNERMSEKRVFKVTEPFYESISELKDCVRKNEKSKREKESLRDFSGTSKNQRNPIDSNGESGEMAFDKPDHGIYELIHSKYDLETSTKKSECSLLKHGAKENDPNSENITNQQIMKKGNPEAGGNIRIFLEKSINIKEPLYESISELKDFPEKIEKSNHEIEKNEDSVKTLKNIGTLISSVVEREEPIYDTPYQGTTEQKNWKFGSESSLKIFENKATTSSSNLSKTSAKDALFKHPEILQLRYSRQKSKSYDFLLAPKPPLRTSSLKSVDESCEMFFGSFEDFCCHGYKNGCTAATQRPEDVSQEVFKENFLQRLESLRQRESLLKGKELTLNERERLLFKKEKELRIFERLVREKMQKAELYLKRCRSSQNPDLPNSENLRESEFGFAEANSRSDRKTEENLRFFGAARTTVSEDVDANKIFVGHGSTNSAKRTRELEDPRTRRNVESRISSCSADSNASKSSKNSKDSGDSKSVANGKKSKSPENSEGCGASQKLCTHEISENFERCRSNSSQDSKKSNISETTSSKMIEAGFSKNPSDLKTSSKFDRQTKSRNSVAAVSCKNIAYSNLKYRVKPKVSYDDLDSTLSADPGDSSFAITSTKFDPETFKRPFLFSRSASERRTRNERPNNLRNSNLVSNFAAIDERMDSIDLEGSKVLWKISENISVSRDEDTKFQNYGSIDERTRRDLFVRIEKSEERRVLDDKRCSYLNLESGRGVVKRVIEKNGKDRPISWNDETNEWLQKKRQAYNMATKKMAQQDFENKENVERNVKNEKFDKSSKKKEGRGRRFTIFR